MRLWFLLELEGISSFDRFYKIRENGINMEECQVQNIIRTRSQLDVCRGECSIKMMYVVDGVFWYTKHVHYTLVWICLWN
jgi:hypothetical protein